jgi:hypothetical protein
MTCRRSRSFQRRGPGQVARPTLEKKARRRSGDSIAGRGGADGRLGGTHDESLGARRNGLVS